MPSNRKFRLRTLQRNKAFPKGIPYAILEGSPKISGSYDGTKGSEEYLIDSDNLRYLLWEFFPLPLVDKDGIVTIGRFAPRYYPAPDPTFVDLGFMYATSWSAEPFIGELPGDPLLKDSDDPLTTTLAEGDDELTDAIENQAVNYGQLTKVTINYEAQTLGVWTKGRDLPVAEMYDPECPETFCERKLSTGGEFLSINPAKTKATKGALGDNEGAQEANADKQQPIVKVIPSVDISVRWTFNPDPDWVTLIDTLGKVNDRAAAVFFDMPAETILFMGFEARPKFVWFGDEPEIQPSPTAVSKRANRTRLWDIDYKFAGRRVVDANGKAFGWNHVWSPNAQTFVRVKLGENDLYVQEDLVQKIFRAKVPA